jgi:hypothetical protein
VKDAPTPMELVAQEIRSVRDERVVEHIRRLLVTPYVEDRSWDYGETFPCWIVLDDRDASDTGIAYCEFGFGPTSPWGLLSMDESKDRRSMGMDSGWFPTFMDAFFNSFACSALPIWRVFSMDGGSPSKPLTDEMAWDDAWAACHAKRLSDPRSHYMVHHSILYGAAACGQP